MTNLVARYGGEEFICLLDDATVEKACQTGEHVRQMIADARLKVEQNSMQVTISVGIAIMLGQETNNDRA